ncbi:MAG: flagellar export protein FliJ [Acidobacteriota bacterium]
MKKFSFSLQSVLDLRSARRELAARELAEAQQQVENAEAQLEKTHQAHNNAIESYINALSSGVDVQELALHTDHIASLAQRSKQEQAHITTLEQLRDNKREAAMLAEQEAKAIAKLRECHYQRYCTEVARKEQALLDELATINYFRNLK